MSFLEEKLGWEPELNQGLMASVVFHIALLLVVYFGVPNIFEDEIIVAPMGIEAALVSDITAAPKVDKAGKPTEKPKQQQAEQTKKKETAPAPEKPKQTASVTPPPPPPEEKVVALPDKEKPKEEEKPKEKEPEKPKAEEKPKEKPKDKPKEQPKEEPDPLAALLNTVLDEPAAEPTPEKPKNQARPEPAEPTTGPQTAELSVVPLSAMDADNIGAQIGKNWSVDIGSLPDPSQYLAWVRVKFDGAGRVLGVEFMEPGRMSDPRYRMVAESCRRAFMITERVQFPPGKEQPVIQFGCDPRYAGF
ncbi:cell division and transport-associated protein TolA [Dongia mobilis]|uniref:Cell division and transport-associated protein TolA n=1 Tax=Dongia mobilis TaxID=578943 RepID=A0A4R6WH41_9PROT|nr:hypothetical protein [Dongia mobilis]TDQ77631.1 cell division and transport-associated protein TolA [Dongia mobilis]